MQKLSVSQLSDLSGKTRETCAKRLAGLTPESGPRGALLYHSDAALAAIYEVSEGGEQGALMRERALNLAADTRLKELREQELLGTLAPIAAMEWCVSNICAQISAVLATLPSRLKRRNPHLTAVDLDVVRKEVARVCEIASRAKIELDAPDSEPPV